MSVVNTKIYNLVNNSLIFADKTADYIPLLSTLTTTVNLIQKICMEIFSFLFSSKGKALTNSYLVHICHKSTIRNVALLVPFLGNIAVMLYDLKCYYQEAQEKALKCKELERRKASLTGIALSAPAFQNPPYPLHEKEREEAIGALNEASIKGDTTAAERLARLQAATNEEDAKTEDLLRDFDKSLLKMLLEHPSHVLKTGKELYHKAFLLIRGLYLSNDDVAFKRVSLEELIEAQIYLTRAMALSFDNKQVAVLLTYCCNQINLARLINSVENEIRTLAKS